MGLASRAVHRVERAPRSPCDVHLQRRSNVHAAFVSFRATTHLRVCSSMQRQHSSSMPASGTMPASGHAPWRRRASPADRRTGAQSLSSKAPRRARTHLVTVATVPQPRPHPHPHPGEVWAAATDGRPTSRCSRAATRGRGSDEGCSRRQATRCLCRLERAGHEGAPLRNERRFFRATKPQGTHGVQRRYSSRGTLTRRGGVPDGRHQECPLCPTRRWRFDPQHSDHVRRRRASTLGRSHRSAGARASSSLRLAARSGPSLEVARAMATGLGRSVATRENPDVFATSTELLPSTCHHSASQSLVKHRDQSSR